MTIPFDLSDLTGVTPSEVINSSVKHPLIVDLNAPVSLPILSGLLSMHKADLYAGFQNGRLPANKAASLSECLQHYITWLKNKNNAKKVSVSEAIAAQQIKLQQAKTEQTWLEVKKSRSQLVDINELAILFEPMFSSMRQQLLAVSRKHPEAQTDLEKLLNYWNDVGSSMASRAEAEAEAMLRKVIDEELTFSDEDV